MKGRTAILFLQAVIVCASLLTSLEVVPGPDLIGIVLAFYTLLFLPGLMLNRLLSRRYNHPLEEVCRVFTLGVAYASLLVCLGFVPGISYRVITYAGTGIIIVLLILDHIRDIRAERRVALPVSRPAEGGGGRERGGAVIMLLLFFIACFVLFAGSGESGAGTDALDHISFARRGLDSQTMLPHDSFHRDGDGVVFDPRKGIWHPVLALWACQSEAPVETLWAYTPAVLSFFALAAFAFCAWQLLGSFTLVVPACMFLFLFYRGEGIGWFAKIAFSRNIAQVLIWCALAFLVRYCRGGGNRYLLLIFLLSLIGVAVHLVFFLLLVAIAIGMLLFVHLFGEGRDWRRRFWLSVSVIVLAVALPLALRAVYTVSDFNEIHTHRQAILALGGDLVIVDPAEIVARTGLSYLFALVLAPFVFWIAPRGKERALVGTLFLVPAAIVLLPFTASPLAGRFGYLYYRILYASPLMCLLVIGLAGLFRVAFVPKPKSGATEHSGRFTASAGAVRGVAARWGKPGARDVSRRDRAAILATSLVRRIVAVAAIAVFILFPLRFALRSFAGSARQILAGAETSDGRYGTLRELLARKIPPHSVIVSDPRTSYVVSAYTDHFVVVTLGQHCSPADTAALTRSREIRDLMSPAVPLSDSVEWLRTVQADFILVDTRLQAGADFFGAVMPEALPRTAQKFRSCPAVLRPVAESDGFCLFELEEPISSDQSGAACTERLAGTLPCRYTGAPPAGIGEDRGAGAGIVVEHVYLHRKVYAAGDTINGSLCWRVAGRVAFGLPFEWTIRLDTDFPRGPFFREWYGKLYRRRIERQGGILYRLTRTFRVESGVTHPDMWGVGDAVRQDFSIILPREMAPGPYRVKVAFGRAAYLPNRTIRDYFTNDDSLDGTVAAEITVVMPHALTPSPAGMGTEALHADTSDE